MFWSYPRTVFAATAAIVAGLLGFGYYLQYQVGLEPCPMCIFQRLCFMAVLLLTLLGTLHGPRGRIAALYAVLVAGTALLGAAIAGRQVWLQHLPEDQVPQCGPGLDYMLEMYPLGEVITKALRGTGECASVDWTFLGGSIASWSLVWFVLFVLLHGSCAVGWVRTPVRIP